MNMSKELLLFSAELPAPMQEKVYPSLTVEQINAFRDTDGTDLITVETASELPEIFSAALFTIDFAAGAGCGDDEADSTVFFIQKNGGCYNGAHDMALINGKFWVRPRVLAEALFEDADLGLTQAFVNRHLNLGIEYENEPKRSSMH